MAIYAGDTVKGGAGGTWHFKCGCFDPNQKKREKIF
jgi:hypothetical protein